MRDLFANTNPLLLTATLIISVLHIVLEILAFKHDVTFWQACDPATIDKYVSVKSILVGILMQFMCLLYLIDENANPLVIGSGVGSLAVDVWKVQRVRKPRWTAVGIGRSVSETTASTESDEDFDAQAMRWLGLLIAPLVASYGIYTLANDCYRSWYSYFVTFAASCMYSLGFVLMTPQVFINYKRKSVTYLPWRKFIYRAVSTFIDDFFAFLIRMPTMHRLSCFRDDVVFLVYVYQRHLYPVDATRLEDEAEEQRPTSDVCAAHGASFAGRR